MSLTKSPRSGAIPLAAQPAPPSRLYSFTGWQASNPTAPPPGDRMDADYDNTNTALTQTLSWAATSLNTDGSLKAGSVGQSQLVSGLFDDIAQDIIDEVQPLVDSAQGYASAAGASSTTAQAAATAADTSNTAAGGAATTATAAANTAVAARNTAQTYATTAQTAATNAQNADNHATGEAALAQDYADVTQAWAEHMPDTIPPNILAVMGVTGSHWSSRWWANQAVINAKGGGAIVNVLDHGAKGDGSTNDTDAIQTVINAYAGKATVFVPDTGQPYMCFPLVPQTGTDMLILGTLKLLPASPNALIVVNAGTSRVTLRGNGILDGNGAAQTTPFTIGNVYLNQSSNIQISGLTIQNANAWNLNVVQCSNVLIDGVTLLGGWSSNEFASGSSNCWMTGCTVDGPAQDSGLSFYGGVTNSGAIGNIFRNAGVASHTVVAAINLLCDGPQPAPCRDIVIADNVIHDTYGGGISVDQGVGGTSVHEGVIIANNRCRDNGAPGFLISDIYINYCVGAEVIGNQCEGLKGGPAHSLAVGPNATGANFTGNQVYNVGPGGTTGVGLFVNSGNIVFASGNQFVDNSGTLAAMASAIGGVAGLRNAFVGNFCDRPVSLTLQSDTVMDNVVSGHPVTTLPINAASDAAAAAAGVPPGGEYRNGSIKMIRVV